MTIVTDLKVKIRPTRRYNIRLVGDDVWSEDEVRSENEGWRCRCRRKQERCLT